MCDDIGKIAVDCKTGDIIVKTGDNSWTVFDSNPSSFITTIDGNATILTSTSSNKIETGSSGEIFQKRINLSNIDITRFIIEHKDEISNLPDAFTAVEWTLEQLKKH